MFSNKLPKNKGQGALEYLLLCGIVAFVSVVSFAPSGFMSKVASTSGQYYNTITSVIQGRNPQPINGGWCNWIPNPSGREFRSCECPAAAFGGTQCVGDSERVSVVSGGGTSTIPPGSPLSTTCGDGILNYVGEQCDYGTKNGVVCQPRYGASCTYCSSSCQLLTPFGGKCNDGVIQGPEECDDGDKNDDKPCIVPYGVQATCDACTKSCQKSHGIGGYCGDGIFQKGPEACDGSDPAAASDPDNKPSTCNPPLNGSCPYCDASCHVQSALGTHCGDGVKDIAQGEECDDGTNNDKICSVTYGGQDCTYCTLGCKNKTIKAPRCGDKKSDLSNGEECDSTTYCNGSCKCDLSLSDPDGAGACLPICGNNKVNPGEDCDAGTRFNGEACLPTYNGPDCYYCSTTCKKATVVPAKCGDVNIDVVEGEECDDNVNNGKKCIPDYAGAACNYCSSTCKNVVIQAPFCGDGHKDDPDEECDKGGSNGTACTTPYGGQDCNYCTNKCKDATVIAAKCGDGKLDTPNEACEGTAHCTACQCDAHYGSDGAGNCVYVPWCGDGKINGGEACDASDPASIGVDCVANYNQTCEYCSFSCNKITKTGPYCGDNSKDAGEQCDGVTNCNSCSCAAHYTPGGGNSCMYVPYCGDGTKDPGEQCDGVANCSSCSCVAHYTPDSGNSCSYVPYCGDNSVNAPGEVCDGGAGCSSCQCPAHYTPNGGNGCSYVPYCGDNSVNAPGEVCDGGAYCSSCQCPTHYGPNGGNGCAYVPYCGDNITNGSDQCDGGSMCTSCQCPANAQTSGNGCACKPNYLPGVQCAQYISNGECVGCPNYGPTGCNRGTCFCTVSYPGVPGSITTRCDGGRTFCARAVPVCVSGGGVPGGDPCAVPNPPCTCTNTCNENPG